MVGSASDILRITRWKNLLIVFLMPWIFHSMVFVPAVKDSYFNLFVPTSTLADLLLLGLFMALIAAGGNIINDITDHRIDGINKPNQKRLLDFITEKVAYILYAVLTLSGVALSFFLNEKLDNGILLTVAICASMLLWVYSSYFKASILIGNVIVSLLSAIVPLVYFYFEIQLYMSEYVDALKYSVHSIFELPGAKTLLHFCLTMSGFAFLISLLREIIKDIEDQKGDSTLNGRTLPIYLGETVTSRIAVVLTLTILVAVIYISYQATALPKFDSLWFQSYVAIFVDLPLALIVFLLLKNPANFGLISGVCKFVMLGGICSAFVYAAL